MKYGKLICGIKIMFQKLKEFCRIKKEKEMSTTTKTSTRSNKEVTALKKTVANQSEMMATLLTRMSAMTDEITNLKNEIKTFKKNVANDVKYLTNRVDG
tara:strand:- start:168 stop:464 length:297 start_codon:yes stop_codon:yes gene_type:complete